MAGFGEWRGAKGATVTEGAVRRPGKGTVGHERGGGPALASKVGQACPLRPSLRSWRGCAWQCACAAPESRYSSFGRNRNGLLQAQAASVIEPKQPQVREHACAGGERVVAQVGTAGARVREGRGAWCSPPRKCEVPRCRPKDKGTQASVGGPTLPRSG
eukprot:3349-Chlamydomonas_euryale.AAC.2